MEILLNPFALFPLKQFQENLVVWKSKKYDGVAFSYNEFQENLVVWK